MQSLLEVPADLLVARCVICQSESPALRTGEYRPVEEVARKLGRRIVEFAICPICAETPGSVERIERRLLVAD